MFIISNKPLPTWPHPPFSFFAVRRKQMREQLDGEREKKNKKIICTWTVTVHICTVIVHLQNNFVYLYIFTSTDVGIFWIKMYKIKHFLYFANFYNHVAQDWSIHCNLFHWTAFQRHDRRNEVRLDKIKVRELWWALPLLLPCCRHCGAYECSSDRDSTKIKGFNRECLQCRISPWNC